MPGSSAWLIDVFGTTIDVDFGRVWDRIASAAGLPADDLAAATREHTDEVMVGRTTFRGALAAGLAAYGAPAGDDHLDELMAIDRRAVVELAHVYDDALGLLERVRAAGDRLAFLSNCDDNTRYFLVELGLAARVDVMVLSHEVRSAKPDPAIYRSAMEALEADPDRTTLVDDDPEYCQGALELGIAAIRIARSDAAARVERGGPPVVRSLDDIGRS